MNTQLVVLNLSSASDEWEEEVSWCDNNGALYWTFLLGGSRSLKFRRSVVGKAGNGAGGVSDSDCTTEEALTLNQPQHGIDGKLSKRNI
jgi:hypothetical protein